MKPESVLMRADSLRGFFCSAFVLSFAVQSRAGGDEPLAEATQKNLGRGPK